MSDRSPRHLVSYFDNRYLDHFRRDLDEIVDHGFNGIVHCVTEADLEWRMGSVQELFAATKDAGLECWADPWGVGGVFGGEAHSGFLGRSPQAMQRASDGRVLPHACLRHPDFVSFLEDWVRAVADAGAEVIFWDEPHLGRAGEDAWACACDLCREAMGGEIPPAATESVLDFRVRTALEFLDRLSRFAGSLDLGNSVCLYPLGGERARRLGLPRLQDVARLESVDDIAVDPYPVFIADRPIEEFDAERFVGGWAKKLHDLAAETGVTAHLWIQGFLLPEGHEDLVEACAGAARRNGVSDLAFWGFRAASSTSLIRPARPEVVWEAARRAFRGPDHSATEPGAD